MPKRPPEPFAKIFIHFGEIEDPRVTRTRHHELLHVLAMSLSGVICGADGWEALEEFAESRREWFEQFFDLPYGTPSADTFRRVFSALDPEVFESCFRSWIEDVAAPFRGEVVALDGKTLRGAFDRANAKSPLHLVHAWATEQHLVLGQKEAEGGASGEPATMVEMMKRLKLRGSVITVDANGCTAAVTIAAREAGADFVLATKGNRKPQLECVQQAFAAIADSQRSTFSSTESGHGRSEARIVHAISAVGWKWPEWRDVKSFVMVERVRKNGDEAASTDTHFFISSLAPDAAVLARKIRAHWGIENFHWMLDVAFREDDQLIQEKVAATNFAVLNRLALMMLRNEKTKKKGAPTKRKRAGWDTSYLELVMIAGLGIT